MSDEQFKEPVQPANVEGGATSKSPAETVANNPDSDKQSDVSKLTAEEQMALFEDDLKDNDWGHQPC